MKLQYLGTAAAEGIPAIFCDCENCRKSREAGGKNIRTRSQALIDDELLIDFPADTYMHFLNFEMPLTKIKNCLKSNFIYSLSSASKLASLYGSYIARGDIEPLWQLSDRTNALTTQDIKECANRYFNKDKSTTIILKGTK
mgnify:CR=1 FL=1